jgi:hypothetical protein
LIIGDVFPVGKRDEVFELRLYELSGPLALVCDGIVSNIALGIDLEREGVSRLCLGDRSMGMSTDGKTERTFFFPRLRGY